MKADVETRAKAFEKSLKEAGLKYIQRDNNPPVFDLAFGGGDFAYPHVAIYVCFDEDGESVHVCTSTIASIPKEKIDDMLRLINDLHCRLRWVRFYIDQGRDLVADADLIIDGVYAGAMCTEIVQRTASIIDDAYPEIMKVLWSE